MIRCADQGPSANGGRQIWFQGSWDSERLATIPDGDLVEFGQHSFTFVIEDPHRIKNFADGCGCFCPVSFSKSEDAIVAQITHYHRIRDFIVC
jgi:hypothetical protein